MIGKLVLLSFVAGSLAQEIAKQKCQEYTALARAQNNSLQCGTFKDKQSGVTVEPQEFPSVAILGYVKPGGEITYLCDATLISEDTLVTAGHCLQQKAYGRPKWVRIGATHSTLGVEVEVKESLCHPQYHPGHDIAIVKLKEKLNSTFVPACLDTEGVSDGVGGIAVGRPIGDAYLELTEKCPIKARLTVQPSQQCVDTFPKQNISADATICVRDLAHGPGDCMSGPFYVSKEQCAHTVVGVASFGKVCHKSTPDADRTPSVYTRVAHYIKWIEERTWPTTNTTTA